MKQQSKYTHLSRIYYYGLHDLLIRNTLDVMHIEWNVFGFRV